KTIGIIWLLLIATGYANAGDAEPPLWTIVSCYLAIGLGVAAGLLNLPIREAPVGRLRAAQAAA
ncbi:hypothetical protein JVW24_25555, partial [Vibrio cholerae O1]|nr:hypothetical protein [Vibrio cholerae O1]